MTIFIIMHCLLCKDIIINIMFVFNDYLNITTMYLKYIRN